MPASRYTKTKGLQLIVSLFVFHCVRNLYRFLYNKIIYGGKNNESITY